MGFLKSCIQSLDIFAVGLSMKYKLDEKYKTWIGGLISILIVGLFIFITIVLLLNILNKHEQIIVPSPVTDKSPLKINFEVQNINTPSFQDPNSAIFIMSFYFFNRTSMLPLDLTVIRKSFYVEIQQIFRYLNNTKVVNQSFDLIRCYDKYNKTNIANPDYDISYVWCVDAKNFNLNGDFFSDEFRYLSIKFKKCSDDSNTPEKKLGCDGDDLVKENMKVIGLTIGLSEFRIDPTKHGDTPPVQYSIRKTTFYPSSKFRQNNDIFLTKNVVYGFENLFNKYSGSTTFYLTSVSKIMPSIELISTSSSITYFGFVLRSDNQYINNYRVYKSFFQLISQIGGIWKVLLIIGGLLVYPLNQKMQMVSLTNKIFNLINPERNLSKETYEYYKKELISSSPQLILKVENVTNLEAQVCIDHYREERCKGLPYSLTDSIANLLHIPSEKRRIKNSIFEIAESKLNTKLAISNIFMFVQQIEMIKQIIFKEMKMFVEYSQASVVHLNKLSLLRLKYQLYQYDEHSTPLILSLNKVIKFLNGMRAVKNKNVLNEKIDINLIKRFNLPSTFLKKYFVAHFDTISKHLEIN